MDPYPLYKGHALWKLSGYHFWPPQGPVFYGVFRACFLYHVGPFACQKWSSLNVTVAHATMIYHILHPGFSTIVTIFQHAPPFSLLMPSCACLKKTKNVSMMFYGQLIVLYSKTSRFRRVKHLLIGIVNAVEITCTASTWSHRSLTGEPFPKRVGLPYHVDNCVSPFLTVLISFVQYTSACIFHYTFMNDHTQWCSIRHVLGLPQTYFTVERNIVFLQFVPNTVNTNLQRWTIDNYNL